ncbi:MAG: fumarylacetoacetate hydrolase family protein [Cyanobacteria bacterium J06638_22]
MSEVIEMDVRTGAVLPEDAAAATLVGRIMTVTGPAVGIVRGDEIIDVTESFPTVTHLLGETEPALAVQRTDGPSLGSLEAILSNSDETRRDPNQPYLLAPVDLQAIKACGVTFASSMIERVVEEAAKGDPSRAQGIRQELVQAIGTDLRAIRPGSDQARELKALLEGKQLWSQYLEVGLGVDAEIFTKCQPLGSVGFGAWVGLHPRSTWNNPEPEVALVIAPDGSVRGAVLGNDVNLRDFEGRSALLLGKAKDNNGSSALGPFVRLFDESFGLDDVREMKISLTVKGGDGFQLDASSSLAMISRDPLDLARQLFECHHYPDGAVLYTGTMFAPTKDRDKSGEGFTHKQGDRVEIATSKLGTLTNRVGLAPEIEPWRDGALALFRSLAARGIKF